MLAGFLMVFVTHRKLAPEVVAGVVARLPKAEKSYVGGHLPDIKVSWRP